MADTSKFNFFLAESAADFKGASALVREYAATLNFDLSFQNFDAELKELHIQYNKPDGGLVLISHQNILVGCAGVRKSEEGIGELKRMYIQPAFRGHGLGTLLMQKALELAKIRGYLKLRLDTLRSMNSAIQLYRRVGFYEIEAYRFNPNDDVLYLEKDIK